MRLFEFDTQSSKVDALKQFVGWAIDRIGITEPPRVKFGTDVEQVRKRRTFGSTSGGGDIWVHIENRNTADIMRTLMHELVHHKQFEDGTAHSDMTEDEEQYIEDEANALAGRLMREYGKQHADIYENVSRGRRVI
jgi:Zn-dependent peptidase ImmA (M78 family)